MATVNREFTAASEGPFQWNDTNFSAYTLRDTSTGDEFYLRKQSGAFEFRVKDNSDSEDWLALRMIIDTGKVEFPQGIVGSKDVALDLGDDGSNESDALEEIATSNNPGDVFTEPSPNKLLISLDQAGSWYLPYVDGNSDMILEEAIRLQAKGSTSSDVPQLRLERKDDVDQDMFVQFEEAGGNLWRTGVLQGQNVLSFEHFAGGVSVDRALELHTGFSNPIELRPNGESKIEGFKSTITSYTSGWTGSGFKLDETGPDGKPDFLELSHLSVRGTLRVRELEIRQLTFSKGPFGITPGGGKLASVSSSSHTNVSNSIGSATEQQWTFENSNDQPTEHGLAQGDRILAQQFDPSSQTVVSQVRAVVDSVVDAYTVNVSVDQTYTVPSTGEQTDPYEFIVVASSNAGRDSLIYNDPYNPSIDLFDGLSDFSAWDNRSPVLTVGDLGHISGLSGRGLYLELDSGEITNAGGDFTLDSDGFTVPTMDTLLDASAYTIYDESASQNAAQIWGDDDQNDVRFSTVSPYNLVLFSSGDIELLSANDFIKTGNSVVFQTGGSDGFEFVPDFENNGDEPLMKFLNHLGSHPSGTPNDGQIWLYVLEDQNGNTQLHAKNDNGATSKLT